MQKISNIIREVTAGYNLESQADENMYHNTKALLELYSKVLWRIRNSLKEMDQECRENTNRRLTELINSLVDIDPRINRERLNTRLKSIEESKSIIDFIDLSLLHLKDYPEVGERYYSILISIYIKRTNDSIEQIAENHGLARSTFFREKKKAISVFGVILWGFLVNETY